MQERDLASGAKEYGESYLTDVLGLAEGAKEEEIEERLIAEAKELGIHFPAKKVVEEENEKRPVSMPTLSEDAPRRSSVDSRTSVATSMISTTSGLPVHGNGISASRASLSFRDYDSFLARGRREGRASISFSPPRTPSSNSVFSLPLSSPGASPKKPYRLMKGLSMLKLNRVDSVVSARGCPHCPRDPLSQRRAVHKLPCGHRLCTPALRETIKAATSGGTGAIPSCCGMPIPGCLVEHVMTQQEQGMVLDRLDQWSQAGSGAPSMKSEARDSVTMQRPVVSRTGSDESKVDSVAPESRIKTKAEETRPEIKQLRKEQTKLHDRFIAWIETGRAQLSEKHERWRRDMRARHEAAAESLEEHHAHSMSEAEDKQVQAEADLRLAHDQESRDTATALKHMEAYCAGTYVSTGEPHGRIVTAQDLAGLENARRVREGLEARHASAINVLRGEQARRLKLRGQRQERELVEMRRGQRKEELEGERLGREEFRGFEEFVEGRWVVLRRRWEAQERVKVKRVEMGCEDGLVAAKLADLSPDGQHEERRDVPAISGAEFCNS